MGLYDMTSRENDYYSESLSEANELLGTECTYYEPLEVHKDTLNDEDIKYGEGITVNVVFESHPKPVMKNLNWLVGKDSDILPLVAYISDVNKRLNRLVDVSKYGKLVVPYKLKQYGTREFKIDRVSGDSLNPIIWICSLVPIWYKTDMNPNTPDTDDKVDNGDGSDFDYIKWGDN